jgi:hypothetical protein
MSEVLIRYEFVCAEIFVFTGIQLSSSAGFSARYMEYLVMRLRSEASHEILIGEP